MSYRPSPFVVAVFVPSMMASLETVTFAPEITAPDVSLITPEIELWASARDGNRARPTTTRTQFNVLLIPCGLPDRKRHTLPV